MFAPQTLKMSKKKSFSYFDKYGYLPKLIHQEAKKQTKIIVVIPCFNEKYFLNTLDSLKNCSSPEQPIEIIIILNSSEEADKEIIQTNNKTFEDVNRWTSVNTLKNLVFHLIVCDDLPPKDAGVGLARKIGMDEASRRFDSINYPQGLIVCFDADCTVQKNYLNELIKFEKQQTKSTGCSIHFEHPITGNLSEDNYLGIINYELHLRYYVHALRFAGFRLAHQTIGSSMAVRSNIYQKQGGMNKRKAGEDFYFLSKIIPLGNFHDLKKTTVYPSPRQSNRVPFGTGKAISDYIEHHQFEDYPSYNFNSFIDLKYFLNSLEQIFKTKSNQFETFPKSIREYLNLIDYHKRIENILQQSPNFSTFTKRFYSWFDGLKVLKYIHYSRDYYYPNLDIKEAILDWSKKSKLISIDADSDKKEILLLIRALDKGIK